MKRDFLKAFGLEENVIRQILDENSRDIGKEKQKSEAAAAELERLRAAVCQQTYQEAVRSAVRDKGLRFSSKAAERDFISQLQEKNLALQDGSLVGLDEFIQTLRDKEPDAFAQDKTIPRFVAPAGAAAPPRETVPPNVAQAKKMGAVKAETLRMSSEVMKNFL